MTVITLSDLYKELKNNEYPIIDKDEGLVYVVFPPEDKHGDEDLTNRVFKIVEDGDILLLEEISIDFDGMADRLVPGFDPRFLIKQALQETDPATLLKIKERLENEKASVRTTRGCVSLKIGGKPGAPLEFVLRR